MKQHTIRARSLAALCSLVCAAGLAVPASADYPTALENAALLTEKSSYHIDMVESAGDKSITVSGDVESYQPLKMRVTSNMPPQGSMEMIVLSPDTYMRTGGSSWKKFSADASALSQFGVASDFAKNKANVTTTDLGMKLKDGQMLHAYRVTNTVHDTTQTIFIDSAGRMARLEAPNMVMKFSKFGESVNITPPM